jgi:hypothetical protein
MEIVRRLDSAFRHQDALPSSGKKGNLLLSLALVSLLLDVLVNERSQLNNNISSFKHDDGDIFSFLTGFFLRNLDLCTMSKRYCLLLHIIVRNIYN